MNTSREFSVHPKLDILIATTKPDVILCTETWLNCLVTSSALFPSTSPVYRQDRGTDSHGGERVAVRNNLISTMVHKGNSTESISVTIELPNKRSTVVTSFCRPPSTNEDYLHIFIEDFTTPKRNHETSYFYFIGDFNPPDVDWRTSLVSGTSYSTKLNEAIINIAYAWLELTTNGGLHNKRREQPKSLIYVTPHTCGEGKCLLGRQIAKPIMMASCATRTWHHWDRQKHGDWSNFGKRLIMTSEQIYLSYNVT